MKDFIDFISENTQLNESRKGTVQYELILQFANKLKISYDEADDFLIGGGSDLSTVLAAAEKMGYKDSSDSSYDAFWKKIYTRIEYSVMMHLAAEERLQSSDKLL